MTPIDCVKKKIEDVIALSAVPEDPPHSKNVLRWILKLDPKADRALQIAALGHDIERAFKDRKVKRQDYKNYDQFKEAHAQNSVVILKEIMTECHLDEKIRDDVCQLVRRHETGGNERTDLLKNADAISFFEVNLPLYYARNNSEEVQRRCLWGLKRLSLRLKKVVAGFSYKNEQLASLMRVCIEQSLNTPTS